MPQHTTYMWQMHSKGKWNAYLHHCTCFWDTFLSIITCSPPDLTAVVSLVATVYVARAQVCGWCSRKMYICSIRQAERPCNQGLVGQGNWHSSIAQTEYFLWSWSGQMLNTIPVRCYSRHTEECAAQLDCRGIYSVCIYVCMNNEPLAKIYVTNFCIYLTVTSWVYMCVPLSVFQVCVHTLPPLVAYSYYTEVIQATKERYNLENWYIYIRIYLPRNDYNPNKISLLGIACAYISWRFEWSHWYHFIHPAWILKLTTRLMVSYILYIHRQWVVGGIYM